MVLRVLKLMRTAFRAGELTDAAMAAWRCMRLPSLIQELREKLSIVAEAVLEQRSAAQVSQPAVGQNRVHNRTPVQSAGPLGADRTLPLHGVGPGNARG